MVEQDTDFGNFVSATEDEVEEFMSGGMGPHHDYLWWDMRGLLSSAWNNAVIKNLADRVVEKLQETNHHCSQINQGSTGRP